MKVGSQEKRHSLLTDRENLILNCIVESYVQRAKPVGSRFLAKKYQLGISPATIRNVMNDLEEKGFLTQPHVSAGRIPTDKGYRHFVDRIKLVQFLSRNDRRIILENLRKDNVEAEEIFEKASQILGNISSQLGVVLEPRFQEGVFEKMELVPLADGKVLAVISIKSGLIKTIVMEVKADLSRDQLLGASRLINERLHGLALQKIRETIGARLGSVPDEDHKNLILLIIKSSDRLFNFDDQLDLHLGGTHNIVSNPEFSERKDTARILELIESKDRLLTHFSKINDEEIAISIGEENHSELFRNCSIISSRYKFGGIAGALGVVGPTRMHYPKIISLVEYMGRVLSQQLHSG
ncbi:heat-inducible transcriptional repressor HrcA [bacterium]|nr:heat-inducible transcriptional repressor HrcA [bacterium]